MVFKNPKCLALSLGIQIPHIEILNSSLGNSNAHTPTWLTITPTNKPVGFTCISDEPDSIPKVECLIKEGCKQSSSLGGLTWQLSVAGTKKVHGVEVRRE